MSVRYGQKVGQNDSRKISLVNKKNRTLDSGVTSAKVKSNIDQDWVRPSDWLALPSVSSSEQKIVLLAAVFEQGSNFVGMIHSGAYTVDWGDGLTENIASNTQANHIYDYSSLVGTDCSRGYRQAIITVTPQAGQNLTSVNIRINHPSSVIGGASGSYNAPWLEMVASLPLTTSLTIGAGGSPAPRLLESIILKNLSALSSLGTMFYNCAALTNIVIENTISTGITSMGYCFYGCVSLRKAPYIDTFNVSSFEACFTACGSLTTIPLYNTSKCTNMGFMFSECRKLISIPLLNTSSVTSMTSMFSSCGSLKSIPLINTARVTSMGNFLNSCNRIASIPLLNTSLVQNMDYMFGSCTSLIEVPLLDTSSVTSMLGVFGGCQKLATIPLFNTTNVTSMVGAFNACHSLVTIPLLNTSKVTNMSTMFQSCYSLKYIPLIDMSKVTTTANMFNQCYSLSSVPNFNLALCTNTSSMFANCWSLLSVNLSNTSLVTNASSMFQASNKIMTIGGFNLSSVSSSTNLANIFLQCYGLSRILITGIRYTFSVTALVLSQTELETIFTNLGLGTSQTITITNNWGAPTPTSLSSTTTAGSTTITLASTTGLSVGMQVTGVGTPLTTGIANTFTDAGDLVNLTAHGFGDDDLVSFSSIASTTGILINTLYYVVNANLNDFQLSLTLGGSAIALTTNGSGTLKYTSTIASIVPNVSVTMTRPMVSSGTNTLAYRLLQTGTALLKGWAVTG